jgi:CHAT domain-containing protein
LSRVKELAEAIKEKGLRSPAELPDLLEEADTIAHDQTNDASTRALAHRAAANGQYLLNNFELALDHYNEAVSIFDRIGNSTELGRTLHAKVGLLYLMSRFDELFQCSARARTIFEELGDRGRLARLDVNLTHAYHRLDQYSEALACCERAMPVLEESGDSEGLLAAVINKAVVLTALHDFESANELYRRALELAESQRKTAWVLLSRYNLAYMRYLNGETGEALRDFATLRKEFEQIGDERHTCLCRLAEAEILLEIGDLDECVASARDAKRLALRLGLNYEIGKALLFDAAALKRAGKKADAEPLLQEANRRFTSERNNVWSAMSRLQSASLNDSEPDAGLLAEAQEARQVLYRAGLPHHQALADIVVGRLERARGDDERALESFQRAVSHAERSKSAWMQFHAYYQSGTSLQAKNEAAGQNLLRKAEAMLDSLWRRLGRDELKFAFLADRENVYTHLVSGIINESPADAFVLSEKARSRVLRERLVQDGSDFAVESIQRRLMPGETILEYFIAGDDLFVFAVNNDSLKALRLGAASHVREDWDHLERHFARCSVKWERLDGVRRQLEATARTHLETMYRRLIQPVQSEIRSSVVIVPHGFLHGVPFHALFDGRHFLTEHHRVAYSPSAALYCAPALDLEYGPPALIAFSRDGEVSSIREVESVARQFSGAETFVNPSISRLRDIFENPRAFVHLAGHAGIDAVGGKLSWIETPDGRLTNRDLQNMPIRARTVVLTACRTARRHICPGDEWLGLMRAFYMSGASAIISAFWDIRAECAEQFASEFYSHFDGSNAADAVQLASAAIRQEQSHPYFWAGFASFVRRSSQYV